MKLLPNTRIFVPVGPPRAGKTTFCNALPDTPVFSFAEPLYTMIAAVIGEYKTRELRMYNQKSEPISELGGKTLRQALQTLGTEWGRHAMDEDIWVNHLSRRITLLNPMSAAIDDMRFPNEVEFAREAEAIIVRLVPPYDDDATEQAHESETYQHGFGSSFTVQWQTIPELREAAVRIHAYVTGIAPDVADLSHLITAKYTQTSPSPTKLGHG